MTATRPTTDAPTPLARALAAQSAAQLDDLRKARGVDASTFDALAARAGGLLDALASWGLGGETTEPVAQHRATLGAVAALLADPGADAIPPSNDRIYAAVLDITELGPIVESFGSTGAGRDALRAHLAETDPAAARADRLTLAFGAVCRRGGLAVTPPASPGSPLGLELERWRIAAAPAVPLDASGLADAAAHANEALRAQKRPGLILLEAGPSLDYPPLTVADDAVALGAMHERLDAFMLGVRDAVRDAVGDDQAFGLVVHATLPATNAASGRLLFAECIRAVNLCDADDPRADGFRAVLDAMERAG